MTSYDEKVTDAAAALAHGEAANWELARLTYENTLGKGDSESQVGKVSMATWTADVRARSGKRFSERTGKHYKAIWAMVGGHPAADRPGWTEAWDEASGDTRQERGERSAQSTIRNATSQKKAEIARELLNDPEVAEQISEEITDHVAADRHRTAEAVRKAHDNAGVPQREMKREARDYSAMIDRGVNMISVALAAESSGEFTRTERDAALLYFLAQIIGTPSEPTGYQADFVNDKLDSLFSEVEAYANSEVNG